MATRSDVTVDFFASPRIIRVAAPSVELTIQDLHDTVRNIEDEPNAMQYEDLISTAGKEPLGGGVFVGLTSTLNNAVVAFDARRNAVSVGTVTTPDATGQTLIDSLATFISDGVVVGSIVLNQTDGSVASVVSVDSEIQITTDFLGNGVDDQWDSADVYKIWLVIQCEVSGGNLVAEDDVGSPINPILPTIGTQVVRTSSASATLQELLDIQHSSFDAGVTIDTVAGVPGTAYPTGTHRQPSNNLADAKIIASERGFTTIFIIGDFNFVSGDTLTGFEIDGQGVDRSAVNVDTDAVISDCLFMRMTLTGLLDNDCTTRFVLCDGVDFVNGRMFESQLKGTLTLSGSGQIDIIDCSSAIPGVSTPILNLNGGTGISLGIRGYNGGIRIQNKTGTESISVDLASGQIILDADITDGTIVCRGVGKLIDNTTGTTVVLDEMVSGVRQVLMEKIMRNELITDPVAGTITILDDDNVTPFLSGPLFEDTAETQPYRGQGVNVRKRLT